MNPQKPTPILTGPTASGKSGIALELAKELKNKNQTLEIINADSIQVYREFNIGSAKPTAEEQAFTPHHLIDILAPAETFTAGDFIRAVEPMIAQVRARGNHPIIVGGTGFYLKALLYGMWDAPPAQPELRAELEKLSDDELHEKLRKLDPKSAARIHEHDRYRLTRAIEISQTTGKPLDELERGTAPTPNPAYQLFLIDREDLDTRIASRTSTMLEQGFVEEVKRIRAQTPDAPALNSVGYRQVVDYLDGKTPPGRKLKPGLQGLEEEITLATRQLVKKQRTWFRGQTEGQWFMLDRDLNNLKTELRALL